MANVLATDQFFNDPVTFVTGIFEMKKYSFSRDSLLSRKFDEVKLEENVNICQLNSVACFGLRGQVQFTRSLIKGVLFSFLLFSVQDIDLETQFVLFSAKLAFLAFNLLICTIKSRKLSDMVLINQVT